MRDSGVCGGAAHIKEGVAAEAGERKAHQCLKNQKFLKLKKQEIGLCLRSSHSSSGRSSFGAH